jgi:hypothetical protein
MVGASVVLSTVGARSELASRGVRGVADSEFSHTRPWAFVLAPLLVPDCVGLDA